MPEHRNATQIHKGRYIQTSDPGAVGAGVEWLDTTTTPPIHKKRNSGNTGWDTILDQQDVALKSGHLGQFAATTSAQLAGVLSDETGSGAAVFANAPTLVNPIVGTQSPGDNSTKAASTAYVDLATAAAVNGLSWKQAVRAASTANGTLASAFENGDTLDGVTLVTGDRILLKNQSTGAENGIYTVNASGAPTRAADADAGAELVNATVFVSEGTANADTAWTCTNNATPTLGSTTLTFAQIGNGTTYTADESTLHLSSTTFSIKSGGVGTTELAADAVTFAKMQNIATNRLLGRSTASSGDPEEITPGTGLTLSAGTLSVTPGTGGGLAGSFLYADPTKTNGDGTTLTFDSGTGSPTVVNAAGTGLTYDANTTVPGALWMKIDNNTSQWKGLLWALPGDTNYTIAIEIEVGALATNIMLGGLILTDTTNATGGNAACAMLGQHSGISGLTTFALRQATNFMNSGDTPKLSLPGLVVPCGKLYVSKSGSNYQIGFARRGFARIMNGTAATLSFTPTYFGICGYNSDTTDLEIVAHVIHYKNVAATRFGGERDVGLAS